MSPDRPITVSLPLGLFGNATLTSPEAPRVETPSSDFSHAGEKPKADACPFGIDGCCDDIYWDDDQI